MTITNHDRKILRKLAKKQLKYAQSDQNKATEKEWLRHRRFEKGRPMIMVEMGTFEQEVIPHRLQCESELGRDFERKMYQQILNHELFDDDKVVPDYFPVGHQTWFKLFDIDVDVTHAEGSDDSLGHQFNHVITNLKEDMPKLKKSTYGYDEEATKLYNKRAEEVFGDILPVKENGSCLEGVLTQKLVHLMGMENMFMAMYDTPELLKEIMNRIADDYIEFYRFLESKELLGPTTGNQHLGQGTLCYNDELPDTKDFYATQDIWGFMDSQETVGISPEMFGEFFFPSYQKIAKEFGLVSYGCCEPVHDIWDDYLSKLPNLRNLSISPWCDEEKMGEILRNEKVIYHRKPSPNFLGVPPELDEEALRQHIQATWDAAKGCQLEFAQRDVYTIHNNTEKVRRYVEIIREVCQ